MFPMSFAEYVTTTRPYLAHPDTIHPANLQTADTAVALEGSSFVVDDYDLAWQAFLSSGGFPRAVHAFETSGRHDLGYVEDLHAWLRRDIDPDGAQESVLLLLDALSSRATSPLDRSGSASDLGYASKTIFERRLSRLVSSFAALWCPQRDERGRSVAGTKASRAKSWAVAQSPRSAAYSAIQPDRT